MHWSRCSEVVHVYIYNVFIQIICRLYPYGYVERIFICQKDSKFIRAIWKSDILIQRWHHTFQHFWSHFLRLFSSSVKGSRDSHGRSAKAFGLALCSLYRGPFSVCTIHSKNIYNFIEVLQYLSTESTYCMVFWCALVPDHTCYTTLTEPSQKTNESTPCMIHVQRSSSCALSKWSNEWRAHGSRSQATWAEAWFRVILCSALSGIHNPPFEQRVGEKPRLFVWDIMCDSHSSGAEPCGACRACSPCNAAEIWRTDPQQSLFCYLLCRKDPSGLSRSVVQVSLVYDGHNCLVFESKHPRYFDFYFLNLVLFFCFRLMDRQKSAFRWPGKSHFLKPVSTRLACLPACVVESRSRFKKTNFSEKRRGNGIHANGKWQHSSDLEVDSFFDLSQGAVLEQSAWGPARKAANPARCSVAGSVTLCCFGYL